MTYGADDNKFKTSEFGGFIGYEFPVLLRVYAGFVFSGTGEDVSDSTIAAAAPPLPPPYQIRRG